VIEAGGDVEFIKVGDLVSVPFNVACGRCRNCKEQKTGICLNSIPRVRRSLRLLDMGAGSATGGVRHRALPDFNLLKFPDKRKRYRRSRPHVSYDILPTAFTVRHRSVGPGSTVYIAVRAGRLCGGSSARLLGAACVIVAI